MKLSPQLTGPVLAASMIFAGGCAKPNGQDLRAPNHTVAQDVSPDALAKKEFEEKLSKHAKTGDALKALIKVDPDAALAAAEIQRVCAINIVDVYREAARDLGGDACSKRLDEGNDCRRDLLLRNRDYKKLNKIYDVVGPCSNRILGDASFLHDVRDAAFKRVPLPIGDSEELPVEIQQMIVQSIQNAVTDSGSVYFNRSCARHSNENPNIFQGKRTQFVACLREVNNELVHRVGLDLLSPIPAIPGTMLW